MKASPDRVAVVRAALPHPLRLGYAVPVSDSFSCDLLIVGGGLAGGLAALALADRRPDLTVRIVECGDRIGGNHIWSFFASDLDDEGRSFLAPLISHTWPGYDVAFPAFRRRLAEPYFSIRSERLDDAVRAALPAGRVHLGRTARALDPEGAELDEGTRIAARAVIDARGGGATGLLGCGWQKFVGHEVRLAAPHGLDRPVVMDATVEQIDGYRFVYCLPFAPDRLFIEDTYYSDDPVLDADAIVTRIARYAAGQGWKIEAVERSEGGVLPVVMDGDFGAYWAADNPGVAKIGARGGLFHPTTGYSLPDAVHTARMIAALPELTSATLHDRIRAEAEARWNARGFYRLLDRMLFRAAAPERRYRVLERFYRLDERRIARFYAAASSRLDKLRILSGRPPVPVTRAVRALRSKAA